MMAMKSDKIGMMPFPELPDDNYGEDRMCKLCCLFKQFSFEVLVETIVQINSVFSKSYMNTFNDC